MGARENAFLMDLASSGKSIFTIKEARDFWGSPHSTRIAVHRLISKGWLVAIERGKYLIVPLEAGVSRKWSRGHRGLRIEGRVSLPPIARLLQRENMRNIEQHKIIQELRDDVS